MSHPIENVCPKCGALAGMRCIGKRGERKAFHRGRGSRSQRFIVPADFATESPIETIMADALADWIDHHDADATITTQAPVGPYRADMLVESRGAKLVVECDGHAFHSSRDQVEYDKRRDRFFVTQGLAVMRFSGREIQRDPRGCAAQVGVWIRGRQ